MLPDEHCPFLYERSCIIYEWRSLSCRLFGMVAEQAQQEAIDWARHVTDQQMAVFAEEGIELPREVFDQVVPQCDRVRDHQGRRLALDPAPFNRDILERELLHVPADELAVGLNFLEFDAHLALAILGRDKVLPRKFSAMKRYRAGKNADDVTAEVMQGVSFRFADLLHRLRPRRGSQTL